MKKTFSILALLMAISVFSVSTRAQDKQIFNHLSIAPTIGFDGLGVELATPITPILSLRAGYSIFIPPSVTTTLDLLPENVTINGTSRPLREVAPVTLHMNLGAPKLFLDIYPGKHTPFHFTVGAYFANPALMSVDVNLTKTLQANEYASAYIELESGNLNSRITSDKNGYAHGGVIGNVVRPYLGIGFGHNINLQSRVSCTFDMGLVYWGNPSVQTYNYSMSDEGKAVVLTSSMVQNKDKGLIDAFGKIPILPVMKLNVFIRIF